MRLLSGSPMLAWAIERDGVIGSTLLFSLEEEHEADRVVIAIKRGGGNARKQCVSVTVSPVNPGRAHAFEHAHG